MAELTGLVQVLKDLIIQIQQQQTTPSANQLLQNHNLNFESYNEDAESFESYSQRLNNYFKLKGLIGNSNDVDEAKVLVLIHCLGAKHYKLLANLTAPDDPSSKSYDVLMKLLNDNLCPKANILTQQHKFFSRKQHIGENITTFVTSLKELARDAGFSANCGDSDCSKGLLELLIRAQFIRGLHDSSIRESILILREATLDEILTRACAIETSRTENKQNFNVPDNGYGSVFKIHSKRDQSSRSRSTSRNRNKPLFKKNIDLKALGLDKLCLHCGKNNHHSTKCLIINKLKCNSCNKPGHLSKVCITKLSKARENEHVQTTEDDEYSLNSVEEVLINYDDKLYVEILLNGVSQVFECDSGSRLSILNYDDYKKLNLQAPIRKTDITFRTFTGQCFKPVGVVELTATYQKVSNRVQLYIVKQGKGAIIGREWIRFLNININEIINSRINHTLNDVNTVEISVSDILEKYKDVFDEKVGEVPNYVTTLRLKENARPIYLKPRPVPHIFKAEVDLELDRLEKENIIEKADYTNWGTPLVIVPKSDGRIRLCADYKATVNNQLIDTSYPIPRIEDIFDKMKGGKYFCTLDVYKAYLHLKVDEESQKIQAISTHRGTYYVKRLFFGVKIAPNEFHKFIDQFLDGLTGTAAYFDDIIVQGSTKEECYMRLIKVLDKLRQNNIHVNRKKCQFFQRKIQYLGHTISQDGLHKSQDKINTIIHTERPTNVEEVRQFLGFVNYYSKFIPNRSEILYPLNQLLCKNKQFKWTKECENAFNNIKQIIVSDQVLTSYNPDYEIIVATDASPFGLSGVLSHKMPDGNERPVQFISRTLTKAEQQYSQLDKEATAVFWSCKQFFDYIYGKKFTLVVDNKPMMSILHPEKKVT